MKHFLTLELPKYIPKPMFLKFAQNIKKVPFFTLELNHFYGMFNKIPSTKIKYTIKGILLENFASTNVKKRLKPRFTSNKTDNCYNFSIGGILLRKVYRNTLRYTLF